MGDKPQDKPTTEDEQPQDERAIQRDQPEEQPPLSPDDPLLRTQSFYAERMVSLRPKDTADEAELPPEFFQQQMDEYRRRQQAQSGEEASAAPVTEDLPPATDAPDLEQDQEEEDA